MLGSTLKGVLSLVSLAWLLSNASAAATKQKTGTIKDIEHVVLFMQENRAFDHLFGTMHGVRGFADPNVHVASSGRPVWYQDVDSSISNDTSALLPYYINAASGNITEASQCMVGGSNGFQANHDAYNNGELNQWVNKNTKWSWNYWLREDLPAHFAIADGWTIADMYGEAVMASTLPNRLQWQSGSVNAPGGPQTPEQGGTSIDNNGTPGTCDSPGVSCYPLNWTTVGEHYSRANVTWQVYRDHDDFGDDPFDWFVTFQNADPNSDLAHRGNAFLGISQFVEDAANGNLPAVSILIGPAEVSEHPPWSPKDGGSFQQKIVEAVINGKDYDSTVLILSYDETGGFGDHVLPIVSPKDTPGEWMVNPFDPNNGTTFVGPGFRVAVTAVSPWTRGGHVFTASCDHNSQIMLIEQWQLAKGKNVTTNEMNFWRRENKCDMVQMFDFAHPDYSLPDLPPRRPLPRDASGVYLGSTECQEKFPNPQPEVPFGKQTRESSLIIETGFKQVRGQLTEGRYLVFENAASALSFDANKKTMTVAKAVKNHDVPENRFIVHATSPPPATTFNLQFYNTINGKKYYVGDDLSGVTNIKNAATFNITDLGNGKGYTIEEMSGKKFITLTGAKNNLGLGKTASTTFSIFSVTKASDSGKGFLNEDTIIS